MYMSWCVQPLRQSWCAVVACAFVRGGGPTSLMAASLVIIAALSVMLVGVVQFFTDAEEILGLYRPDADLSRELFITTFVRKIDGGHQKNGKIFHRFKKNLFQTSVLKLGKIGITNLENFYHLTEISKNV